MVTSQDNTSTVQNNTSKTQPKSTKEAPTAKLGLQFPLFVTELSVFLNFNPLYQGLIIRPSEMLSSQGHMNSCTDLSGLQDINLKIASQVPKMYIYSLFRVL